jgi:hypothetical protein
MKRNNLETKRNETKIKIKRFGKKNNYLTPCSDLIILFFYVSPVAIENITAQVQDVDISTAHWAQFTLWQPRKSAFYKATTRNNYFFFYKKI